VRIARRIVNALLYLTASPRHLADRDAEQFECLGWAMLLLAGLWGLLLVGVWDLAYHLSWPRRLDWIVPSGLCGAAIVLGACRRGASAVIAAIPALPMRRAWPSVLLAGLGWAFVPVALLQTACRWGWPHGLGWLIPAALCAAALALRPGGRGPIVTALALTLGAVGVAAAINYAVRYWDPDWPTQLPQPWAWLWPRALYRVLILMPVWGAWALLALGRFRPPGDLTDAPTRRLVETTGPVRAAAMLAVPLAGTLVGLMFLRPAMRFVPPAGAVLAGLAGGAILARRRGHLGREVLLGANLLAQMGFLGGYLLVR